MLLQVVFVLLPDSNIKARENKKNVGAIAEEIVVEVYLLPLLCKGRITHFRNKVTREAGERDSPLNKLALLRNITFSRVVLLSSYKV